MPIRAYHLTSLILGFLIAFVIFFLIRKDRLHIRYSMWWIFVAASTAIIGSFPWLVDYIAGQLGVAYPPVLLLTVALGFLLIKILTMDIERSEHERKIRLLTQRLAVYEGDRDYESGKPPES
ncbi:MAG: DUF2304 domain-containing protein [Desulfobacterales bacterium]|nr:DUF2304 domain-containing protein [Desulfobacterales bacterium]